MKLKKNDKLNISDLNKSLGKSFKAKETNKNEKKREKNYYGDRWQRLTIKEKLNEILHKKSKDAFQNAVIAFGVVMLVVLSCVAVSRVDDNMTVAEQKQAAESILNNSGNVSVSAESGNEKDDLNASNKITAGTGDVNNNNDYFINYEMEKEKVRSEQLELLNDITDNNSSLPEAKNEAEKRIISITEDMENEMLLESLLVAKYGGEAIVFVQEDKVNVILRPEGVAVNDNEAEKIAQLVDAYTEVGYENAVIVIKE